MYEFVGNSKYELEDIIFTALFYVNIVDVSQV